VDHEGADEQLARRERRRAVQGAGAFDHRDLTQGRVSDREPLHDGIPPGDGDDARSVPGDGLAGQAARPGRLR
jgi:hypothetical protein